MNDNTNMLVIEKNDSENSIFSAGFSKLQKLPQCFWLKFITLCLIRFWHIFFLCLKSASGLKAALSSVTVESAIQVTGTVRRRPEGQDNKVWSPLCACLLLDHDHQIKDWMFVISKWNRKDALILNRYVLHSPCHSRETSDRLNNNKSYLFTFYYVFYFILFYFILFYCMLLSVIE